MTKLGRKTDTEKRALAQHQRLLTRLPVVLDVHDLAKARPDHGKLEEMNRVIIALAQSYALDNDGDHLKVYVQRSKGQ